MKWFYTFHNYFLVSSLKNFIFTFSTKTLFKVSTLLIFLFIISCTKESVEQIEVEIPSGILVPKEMIFIPKGEFIMGTDIEKKTSKEKKVFLPAFLIDRFETSRNKYAEFNPRYSFLENKGNFPAAKLNYFDAESYCKYRNKRLPTEAEWEKAARGIDGRKWPWLVYYKHPNNGFSGFIPEPVNKRKNWISPYGLYGIGHNVWEWTSSWYDYSGIPAEKQKKYKIIRGGLLQTHTIINFSPTWYRSFQNPNNRFNFLGVRCASNVSKIKS